MNNKDFELAIAEFKQAGGKVETLNYYGPRFTEKTFPQRGYVWSKGATRAALKDNGIGK